MDMWKCMSKAMRKSIELTYYRRWIQQEHNKKNNIDPRTVFSSIKDIWIPSKKKKNLAEEVSTATIEQQVKKLELEMDIAAANMEYEKAAEIRDALLELKAWKKKRK